jgi:hypothetical protein
MAVGEEVADYVARKYSSQGIFQVEIAVHGGTNMAYIHYTTDAIKGRP